MRARFIPSILIAILLLAACGGSGEPKKDPTEVGATAAPAPEPAATSPPPPATAEASAPLVVFLGDSLTAGYGLAEDQAYPAVIAEKLEAEGIPARVVNAGVSGDTTAGGRARLDWLLKQKPAVVVVALGANDGLRGFPLQETETNLRAILTRIKASGARPLLAGMLIPPNYGPEYTRGFAELYPRLARELDVPLIPFLLEGVAAETDLNQADGIHPTAEGQKRVAETVLAFLRPLLDS